jgi:hypothetical protein
LKILRKLASSNNSEKRSSKFRRKRFNIFQNLVAQSGKEQPTILDVGGTQVYWEQLNSFCKTDVSPIITNILIECLKKGKYPGIVGDGKILSYIKDNTLDIVYSNSVIEHFSSFKEQSEMAENIRRVAKYFFVQTPAFVFPLEPHFLFPFFHWLPKKVRIWFVQNFNLGWYQKCQSYFEAEELVASIRILKKKELKELFEDSTVITERFLFIPKSYLITNLIRNLS